jgi:hypothetical protein
MNQGKTFLQLMQEKYGGGIEYPVHEEDARLVTDYEISAIVGYWRSGASIK